MCRFLFMKAWESPRVRRFLQNPSLDRILTMFGFMIVFFYVYAATLIERDSLYFDQGKQ